MDTGVPNCFSCCLNFSLIFDHIFLICFLSFSYLALHEITVLGFCFFFDCFLKGSKNCSFMYPVVKGTLRAWDLRDLLCVWVVKIFSQEKEGRAGNESSRFSPLFLWWGMPAMVLAIFLRSLRNVTQWTICKLVSVNFYIS